MKKFLILALICTGLVWSASAVQALTIDLFDFAFNIDGIVSVPPGDPIPAGVDISGFDTGTGLGTISVLLAGAGDHFVGLFVDHEVDVTINGFTNEVGSVMGTATAGQTWEIDEPGLVNGDIFDNFSTSNNIVGSQLDNSIGTSVFGNTTFPDDVSMALGFDFTLGVGGTAIIDFVLGTTAPAGPGLVLAHTDPDSTLFPGPPNQVFFSSTLNVIGPTPVPLPGTLTLMGIGLVGLAASMRRRVLACHGPDDFIRPTRRATLWPLKG